MRRTSAPAAAGRTPAGRARARGSACCCRRPGSCELALAVNGVAAAVAAVTLISYVARLHAAQDAHVAGDAGRRRARARCRRSSAGPRRPARSTLSGLVLFGIVFFWQMPHFLAIAWMYRDDYARAGIPLLPVLEPDGRRTGQQALLYAAALVARQPAAGVVGLAGAPYSVVATVLGVGFIWLARAFARERSIASARRLFLFSIALPAAALGRARRRPPVALATPAGRIRSRTRRCRLVPEHRPEHPTVIRSPRFPPSTPRSTASPPCS